MIKRSFKSLLSTWLAGLIALLPLAVTVALLGWIISLINQIVGPGSLVGQLFGLLGMTVTDNPRIAWVIGTLLLIAAIYPLGLAVQSGLRRPLARLVDVTLRRIPLIGQVYNLADKFVGMLDQKGEADISAMSPVWCLFGGDGVAVLALMPNPEPIEIEGRNYVAVLVPTAPVPIGGGLLYVPTDWVKPAQIGVDKLTSIYVSMGINPPPSLRTGKIVVPEQADRIMS
ncbi:DUF502 domain-containing protein [Chitinibacteraceae bacterium HSL-7]